MNIKSTPEKALALTLGDVTRIMGRLTRALNNPGSSRAKAERPDDFELYEAFSTAHTNLLRRQAVDEAN